MSQISDQVRDAIEQGEKRWNGIPLVYGDIYLDDALNNEKQRSPSMDWLIEQELKRLPPAQSK